MMIDRLKFRARLVAHDLSVWAFNRRLDPPSVVCRVLPRSVVDGIVVQQLAELTTPPYIAEDREVPGVHLEELLIALRIRADRKRRRVSTRDDMADWTA